MAHPVDPAQMDKSCEPPPCRMQGTPEEQARAQALGILQQLYQVIDAAPAGNPQARQSFPIRPDTFATFQKGSADRVQGQQQVITSLARCTQGQQRDLSGAVVQIFGGSSMLCVVCGDMLTAASQAQSVKHRFADMFLISSDAQGPHVKNMFMREIDADIGPPQQPAMQSPQVAQLDQMGQQFLQMFYPLLDDPAKRGQLGQFIRDMTVLNSGPRMYKGTQHIAHRLHFWPVLAQGSTSRAIEGFDAQPSAAGGAFLFVYGEVVMQNEVHSQRFIDVFHLMPEGASWWITNASFNLHGGGSR